MDAEIRLDLDQVHITSTGGIVVFAQRQGEAIK
jgi:hypothetical protein